MIDQLIDTHHREKQAASMKTITIVPWDPDTDQTVVRHDGVEVWTDSMDRFDQYLRFYAPQGEPVVIEVVTD